MHSRNLKRTEAYACDDFVFRKDSNMPKDKEAHLRQRLVTAELNPIADVLLSIVILVMSPFIYLTSVFHDKLMFKFLNKTYIYNVSWEVSVSLFCLLLYSNCLDLPGSPNGSPCFRLE